MEIWFLVWLFPFGAQGRPRSRGTPVGPLQGAQAKECGTGMHAYALDEQTQAFHWAKSQSRKNYPENTTSHPPPSPPVLFVQPNRWVEIGFLCW